MKLDKTGTRVQMGIQNHLSLNCDKNDSYILVDLRKTLLWESKMAMQTSLLQEQYLSGKIIIEHSYFLAKNMTTTQGPTDRWEKAAGDGATTIGGRQ